MTSKCYSQRGVQLLNLAFLLQSDEANQSQCCNALQSATVAQFDYFDSNFRAMLFGYHSLFNTMALRFATGLVLDQFVCAFNDPISFEEKTQKLSQLKRSCEDAIVNKVKTYRLKDREVFVCITNFSNLQFPNAEGARLLNHE
jgi:hypothetical protein